MTEALAPEAAAAATTASVTAPETNTAPAAVSAMTNQTGTVTPVAAPEVVAAPIDQAMRDSLKAEWEAERNAARPVSATDYLAPDLAADFPGLQIEALVDHPFYAWWQETAHNAGLPQEKFSEGYKQLIGFIAEAERIDPKIELAQLGPDGPQRMQMAAKLGERIDQRFKPLIGALAETALGVELLEVWQASLSGTLASGGATPPPPSSDPVRLRAEAATLMEADDYYQSTPKQERVKAIYAQLYPTRLNALTGAAA